MFSRQNLSKSLSPYGESDWWTLCSVHQSCSSGPLAGFSKGGFYIIIEVLARKVTQLVRVRDV